MTPTQVLDSSGNNLTGTIAGGVTPITGAVGQALSFDGSTGKIGFPADNLTDLTGNVSVALWLKTSNNSRTEAVVSRFMAAGIEAGYLLRTNPSGHMELRIGGNNLGLARTFADTGKVINDGQWHHVAALISTTQGVSLYVDGVLSLSQSGNILPVGSGFPLLLGATGYTPYGEDFNGSLDDVRIYNRVLSAAEITTLASGSASAPPPPPVTTVTPPTFSVPGGAYTNSVTVSLNPTTSNSLIYYSTAGTPTTSSTPYSGPLTLTASTTINAIAVLGSTSSTVASAVYTISAASTPPVTSGSGPAGYWTFDTANVTPAQVIDSSGNNLTGSIAGGVAPATGAIGQALSFDGSTGRIGFPADNLTDLTGNLSVALWLKTSNNSRTEAVVSRFSAAGIEAGYLLRTNPSGHVELRIGGNNLGLARTFADTSKQINDGLWHHVAALISTTQGVSLYVDGVLSLSQAANVLPVGSGFPLILAATGYTPYGANFTGNLDEVRIYNRVLSAAEIAALALGSAAAPPPPPVTTVTPPTFSVPGGAYTNSVTVSLNPTTANSSIYYSTTGTPTTSSTLYSGALTLTTSTTINAIAVVGSTSSTVASAAYTVSTAAPPPVTSGAGPVGYWTFDTASVTPAQVIDSSGNSLTGSIAGVVTPTTGALGQALSFNGSTGKIAFPNDNLTDLTGNVTLGVWVNTVNTATLQAVISRFAAGGPGTGYLLRMTPAGQAELVVGGSNNLSGALITLTDSKFINNGQWHHIAAVITLGQGAALYIDGVLSSTKSANLISFAGASPLLIGANGWAPYGANFSGSMDDARIYNRALSAAEITALASGSAAPPPPPPVTTVTPPTFSVPGGAYTNSVTVSLNPTTANSSIYYSTTGTPTTSSTLYSGALTFTASTTINAIAVVGSTSSTVASAAYTVSTAAPPPVTSGSGPVGFWTFDTANVTPAQVIDSSGNSLTGSISGGVTPTTGAMGQALSFNGSNGKIVFPADNFTDLTGNLTLAVWVKTVNTSNLQAVLSRFAAGGIATGYLLRMTPAGQAELVVGGNNTLAGSLVTLTDSKTINNGQWHHIAAVITLGQSSKLYIDGALSSTKTANLISFAGASPLLIGANGWAPYGANFTGSMDDVRIYNRALNATEIAVVANAPPPSVTPVLTVSPVTVSLSAISSLGNPAPQTIAVSNSGGGNLNWTASPNQSWLTVAPQSGSGDAVLTIGANVGSLTPTTYSGAVTISAPGATPPSQIVNVTLTISAAAQIPTGGNQHFVAPNGSSSGDGSVGNPWDLQTALDQPSSVKPGDTIWLRNGVYGNGSTTFNSNMDGTSTQPILLRQYPGERATVNGGFSVNGSYVWFWGFEVANLSVTNRITSCIGSSCSMIPFGFDIFAPGSKFINMVVHDTGQGFGFWLPATNAEIYGSLIYNNGWQGGDNGHGHGIYTQNQTGTKVIRDNIIFQGFGLGIQAYGSGSAHVENYALDGNTVFNSGVLATNHHHFYNVLFAGGQRPQNITIKNTYTYHTPTDNDGTSELDWNDDLNSLNLNATNNYWIGGRPAISLYNWLGAVYTNNTAYSAANNTLEAGHLSPAGYTWNNNTYYGSNAFLLDSQSQNFASFKASTGLDANSTFNSGRPFGVWTFVRPNQYESGRANVTIYNWDLLSSIPVDLSGVLSVGQHFEVHNAQNFFGSPVVSGVYAGGTVSIPMTGLTVAQATGTVPTPPQPTGPEFGVFVVLQK